MSGVWSVSGCRGARNVGIIRLADLRALIMGFSAQEPYTRCVTSLSHTHVHVHVAWECWQMFARHETQHDGGSHTLCWCESWAADLVQVRRSHRWSRPHDVGAAGSGSGWPDRLAHQSVSPVCTDTMRTRRACDAMSIVVLAGCRHSSGRVEPENTSPAQAAAAAVTSARR